MHRYALFLLSALIASAAPTRLKDLVSIEGIRDNQLVGYGVVVGLAGTGDRQTTIFTNQTLANMLERMGVTVPPATIKVANVASVMVTATLPPFGQPGAKIDATASAIGDARTLQGGVLLMTALKGANGQTYAVAQGPVVTGGTHLAEEAASVLCSPISAPLVPARSAGRGVRLTGPSPPIPEKKY